MRTKNHMGLLPIVQKYCEVTEYSTFSWGRIKNALQYCGKYKTIKNIPRKKPRNTTFNDDRQIVGMSMVDPLT